MLGAAEELRVAVFGGTPLVTRGAVEIFRHDWSLDSSEAVRELGYTMTPLEDGVARTVASIRDAASSAGARAFVSAHSEHARQWVHIGSGAFALLLRVISSWQATALAALALLFNLALLPRIGGRRLYRPADEARGFPLGILLYPLSVLLLTLAFPSRLDIVAAAWGILACGDGAATLVGRRVTLNRRDRRARRKEFLCALRELCVHRRAAVESRQDGRRHDRVRRLRRARRCRARVVGAASGLACCRRCSSRSPRRLRRRSSRRSSNRFRSVSTTTSRSPPPRARCCGSASLMTAASLAAARDTAIAGASVGDRRQRA